MASMTRTERRQANEAHKARMAQLRAEAQAHVARGDLPGVRDRPTAEHKPDRLVAMRRQR